MVITRQSLPLHIGEVAIGYSPAKLGAAGGTPPYAWSIGGGALPAGLSLSSGGSISGTPTAAGTANFALLLTDSAGAAAGYATSITILPQLAATGLCTKQCSVEAGCTTVCGAFGDVSGGVQPYSYQLAQGALPPGMGLSGMSLTGAFPAPTLATAQVPYSFTVAVTDALGAAATVNAVFNVYPHISLASGSCLGNYITGCSARLAISGGIPGGTPSVTLVNVGPSPNQGCWSPSATTPPAGYGLAVSGGFVTVSIPNGIINGYGAAWTLMLTDQSFCSSGTYCQSPAATVAIGVQCG